MRQSSIIIHKGGREEKYEIYVEDYVLSFLKDEMGTLELSEFYFYGFKEKDGKRYVIYGAGRDKQVEVFGKYSLLEEVGCRLTQAGPVFVIRERDSIYEIKGYEVFYQDNREMQSYLIDRKKKEHENTISSDRKEIAGSVYAGGVEKRRAVQKKMPHSVISIQLGIILVMLVAIVINSTNSYDKMQQLNQSASEVFFAIENQEAEDVAEVIGGKKEIVVERNPSHDNVSQNSLFSDEKTGDKAVGDSGEEEDILKLVTLENGQQADEQENIAASEDSAESDAEEPSQQEESGQVQREQDGATDRKEPSQLEASEGTDTQEPTQQEVEALSRNVARYYEVERGDTLYTISQKIYGDTAHVQRICELNRIDDPDHIRYGQKIILP